MAEKKLAVVITGDAKGARKAFGEVESAGGGLQSKLTKVGGGITSAFKGAAVGATLIGGGLAVFGNQLLTSGAQVSAWRQKTNVVFEGQAADVRKWADKNNEAFGLTDDELAGLAASFGDLLKPMGFTAGQAADMSTKVVGLSGALSSWSGGTVSAAGASDILAKAMLGETDGLKSLGIAISAADIDARLAAKGQDKLTGAALAQAKAVATQELIFEKSTDAQKAWADGGNKALLGQNKLKAVIAEVKETIATGLTPVLAAAAGWLGDKLPVALASARNFFDQVKPTALGVASALGGVIDSLRPVVAAIADFVGKNPAPVIAVVAAAVGGLAIATVALAIAENAALIPVYLVLGAMALLVGAFVLAYQKVDWFRTAVDTVVRVVKANAVSSFGLLRDAVGWVIDKAVIAWTWFDVKILPTLKVVAAVAGQLLVQAFGLARDAVGWLVTKGSELWTWFDTKILPTLKTVAAFLGEAFTTAFATGRDAVGWVVTKAGELWRWFDTKILPILKTAGGVLGGAFSTALGTARTAIDTVVGAVRTLWDWLKKAMDRVGDLVDKLTSIPGAGVIGDVLGAIPGFAAGGRPAVGRLSIVGERGPELFVPDRPGTIVPAASTRSMLSGRGGGGDVYLTLQVNGHVLDGRELGRLAAEGLHQYGASQNRPIIATGLVGR